MFQVVSSDTESIFVGAPQRSIIGPLLFVLNVNDLPTVAGKCSMLIYADDTVLFYSGKVAVTIEKSLNKDLDLIGSWLHNVTFKSRYIKRVFKFKYLRVVLDEYISWNSHVKYVLFRAGKRLGMPRRIRGILHQTVLVPFTQLIFVWNCCGVSNSSSLERLPIRTANCFQHDRQ